MKRAGCLAVAAALGLAVPALAGGPSVASVDFDQGVAAGDILQRAKDEVKAQNARHPDYYPGSPGYGPVGRWRYERDCAQFVFEPNGQPVSESVWLRSTEWVEECRNTDPRNGGGYDCWERPGFTYRKKAQVELANRQPVLPWERERFTVCLEGNWLTMYQDAAAYDYQVYQDHEGYYRLVAGRKIPMDPDPSGIMAGSPVNTGSGIAIEFRDRWAASYAGEQTVIGFQLVKSVPGWFDAEVAKGELSFAAADSYRIDFGQFNPKLEAGKPYYVKWSFKRVGRISKPTAMKRGETDKVVFARSLASWAGR